MLEVLYYISAAILSIAMIGAMALGLVSVWEIIEQFWEKRGDKRN